MVNGGGKLKAPPPPSQPWGRGAELADGRGRAYLAAKRLWQRWGGGGSCNVHICHEEKDNATDKVWAKLFLVFFVFSLKAALFPFNLFPRKKKIESITYFICCIVLCYVYTTYYQYTLLIMKK